MTTTQVKVPADARILTETPPSVAAASAAEAAASTWAAHTLAVVRVGIGWTFLWAFLDKTFGLGFATENADAWIRGGSPTNGYLSFATRGPLAEFYQSFAGAMWADWLFMIGLAGIGIALTLGIGMRIAAVSGAAMLIMMWSAALWPENNPFMDDHLIYAMVLGALAFSDSGATWGLGTWWKSLSLVDRYPILR